MPRAWYECIRDWPSLAPTKWYIVRIVTIERANDQSAIRVGIEFLDPPQDGRRMEFVLPLPVRPNGLAADFFSAAGIEMTPRRRIRPRDGVGQSICVRFDASDGQPIAFKPAPEGENTHERDKHNVSSAAGEPSSPAAETPEPDGDGRTGR